MLLDPGWSDFFAGSKKVATSRLSHASAVTAIARSNGADVSLLTFVDASGALFSLDLKCFSPTSFFPPRPLARVSLGAEERVTGMAANPSGTLFALASRTPTTRLVRCTEEVTVSTKTFPHAISCTALVDDVRANQSLQLVGGADRVVVALDCEFNREFRRFEGHAGAVRRLLPLQGCLFLSSAMDKCVRLWDLRVPNCVRVFESSEKSAPMLSVDSTKTCLALAGRNLACFELRSGRAVVSRPLTQPFAAIDFAEKERMLAGACGPHIDLWDLTAIPAKTRTARIVDGLLEAPKITNSLWLSPDDSPTRNLCVLNADGQVSVHSATFDTS